MGRTFARALKTRGFQYQVTPRGIAGSGSHRGQDGDNAPKLSEAAAARRKALLLTARACFFASGYGATTMSKVAARAGGSKTTLWSYFPSKERLFAAVVDDILADHCTALTVELPVEGEVEAVLEAFGHALLESLLSSPMLELYRLIIGEAARFPQLAGHFYDRGPKIGRARLASWMGAKIELCELRPASPAALANLFASMCLNGEYQRTLLSLPASNQSEAIAAELGTAVETFCAAWKTS